MWLAGSENRERWYRFRFRPGQVIEGAVRDNDGQKQGTILVEVLEAESTDSKGHWFVGRYILASDSHLRWWMSEGDGARLAKRCRYHCCESSAVDCPEVKKGKGMHMEKFREITQRELDAKVPAWAFGRNCSKVMNAYLKQRGSEPPSGPTGPDLPWRESGEEGGEDAERSESPGPSDLRKKLQEARDAVRKLEKRMAKDEKKDAKKKRDKSVDKKKRKKKSPAAGGDEKKDRKRRSRTKERRRRDKRSESRRRRRRKSTSSSRSGSASSHPKELFGGDGSGSETAGRGGQRDRGPFGGGDVVNFQDRSDSDSESFRDAPADRKAVNQLRLVQYAKKKPGRLASRLLLKMQREGAQGAVGADPSKVGLTPPGHQRSTTSSP